MDFLFRPDACGVQGLVSQEYRPRGTEGHAAQVLQAQAQLAQLGGVPAPDAPGAHAQPPATFHGRGVMVTDQGLYRVWSRDKRGVLQSVDVGRCVPGVWAHLALVQRGAEIRGFLDGQPRGSLAMDGDQSTHYVPDYTVGAFASAAQTFTARGAFDDVRVWDAALPDAAVACAADSAAWVGGAEPSLAAFLRFDDGTRGGDSLYLHDSSSAGEKAGTTSARLITAGRGADVNDAFSWVDSAMPKGVHGGVHGATAAVCAATRKALGWKAMAVATPDRMDAALSSLSAFDLTAFNVNLTAAAAAATTVSVKVAATHASKPAPAAAAAMMRFASASLRGSKAHVTAHDPHTSSKEEHEAYPADGNGTTAKAAKPVAEKEPTLAEQLDHVNGNATEESLKSAPTTPIVPRINATEATAAATQAKAVAADNLQNAGKTANESVGRERDSAVASLTPGVPMIVKFVLGYAGDPAVLGQIFGGEGADGKGNGNHFAPLLAFKRVVGSLLHIDASVVDQSINVTLQAMSGGDAAKAALAAELERPHVINARFDFPDIASPDDFTLGMRRALQSSIAGRITGVAGEDVAIVVEAAARRRRRRMLAGGVRASVKVSVAGPSGEAAALESLNKLHNTAAVRESFLSILKAEDVAGGFNKVKTLLVGTPFADQPLSPEADAARRALVNASLFKAPAPEDAAKCPPPPGAPRSAALACAALKAASPNATRVPKHVEDGESSTTPAGLVPDRVRNKDPHHQFEKENGYVPPPPMQQEKTSESSSSSSSSSASSSSSSSASSYSSSSSSADLSALIELGAAVQVRATLGAAAETKLEVRILCANKAQADQVMMALEGLEKDPEDIKELNAALQSASPAFKGLAVTSAGPMSMSLAPAGMAVPVAPRPALLGSHCPHGCSRRGRCDMRTMTCFCFAGYVGKGCTGQHYPGYGLRFGLGKRMDLPPMGEWNSMTLQAWIRMANDTFAAQQWQTIRSDSRGGKGAVRWEVRGNRVGLAVDGNEPEEVWFDRPLPRGPDWSQVTVTYSRKHANRTGTGSATLYVNGHAEQTISFATTNRVRLGPAMVGAHQGGVEGVGRWFLGELDELAIFGRALAPLEVKERWMLNDRFNGLEPGLLAYYRFDEGHGRVTADLSAHRPSPVMALESVTSAMNIPKDGILGGTGPATWAPTWLLSTAPFGKCTELKNCFGRGKCVMVSEDEEQGDRHECHCDVGWGGKMCEMSLCPRGPAGEAHTGKPCAGHGVCTQTTLDATSRWHKMKPQDAGMFNTTASMLQDEFHTKELASFSAVNSKLDVNRTLQHARDVITDLMHQYAKSPVHQCMCGDGWYGEACMRKACPNDCSGKGECSSAGVCSCSDGYRGEDCSVLTCPGTGDCGGHGMCVNGTCACDAGFSGSDCALANICHPQDCGGHGVCVNGQCNCLPSYTGDDCAWSSACFNFCSGRGKCEDEQCVCDPMYMGIDCSEPRCPGTWSGGANSSVCWLWCQLISSVFYLFVGVCSLCVCPLYGSYNSA